MGKDKRDQLWVEAKKKCRLNEDTIRMAKEMGLNPKSLLKNIPSEKQKWKAPVHIWIQEMYQERKEKSEKNAMLKNKENMPKEV